MKEKDFMFDALKTIVTTLADESKKEIKNPELLAFVNKLYSLSKNAKKIIAKSEKTFNKKEFRHFIGACSVYATDLEMVFSEYMHHDLIKDIKEDRKNGK